MFKKHHLSCFVFVTIMFVFDHGTAQKFAESRYRNQIKFTPSRLVDFINPGIEVLYQRRFSRKLAVEVGVTRLTTISKDLASFDNYHGWRFSLESKRFIWTTRGHYIGVEAVGQQMTFTGFSTECYEITTAHSSHTEFSEVDYYDVDKKMLTVNVNYGFNYNIGAFCFDGSVGIGIKFKDTVHQGRTVEDWDTDCNTWGIISDPEIIAEREGRRATINIPLKITLGYQFGSEQHLLPWTE